jgi:hypothetical protein
MTEERLWQASCVRSNGNRFSVPIPKFASLCSTFVCELRNQRDTSNSMILVRSLDLKFLNEGAAQ